MIKNFQDKCLIFLEQVSIEDIYNDVKKKEKIKVEKKK